MSDYNFGNLYDDFYGIPKQKGGDAPTANTITNIDDLNKYLDREVKRLTEELHKNNQKIFDLEQFVNPNRKKESSGMGRSAPKKKDYDDHIREMIKKAAKSNYIKPPSDSSPRVPVINEVVTVSDISKFTPQTHNVAVHLVDKDYYSEVVETKVVGMETVEWWEYVLIYGLVKQAKITYEYAQISDMVKNGAKSTRTVSGKNLNLLFMPKEKFCPKQTYDVVDGKTVIKEKGTNYLQKTISIEIPLNKVEKVNEYRKGYFIFEEKYNTLVPDYNKIFHEFENLVASHNINEEFIKEAKKQIWTHGRLSGI